MAAQYGVWVQTFRQPRSGSQARDVAAWLARRLTRATLWELAVAFGLNHPGSVSHLFRRVDCQRVASREPSGIIAAMEGTLTKTGNGV